MTPTTPPPTWPAVAFDLVDPAGPDADLLAKFEESAVRAVRARTVSPTGTEFHAVILVTVDAVDAPAGAYIAAAEPELRTKLEEAFVDAR